MKSRHYRWLLNGQILGRPALQNPPNIKAASTEWPPEKSAEALEIRYTSNSNDAPPSMLKDLGGRTISADWKEGYLIQILKKEDLSKCGTYRDITLLLVPRKSFFRVLLTSNFEIDRPDSVGIGRAQTELRRYGSSPNNQLTGTRHYTSNSMNMRRANRRTLWSLHQHCGVPGKTVTIIRNN
ncbi:unnamed protein product [Schistosoma mattheei]|uniref:Uncharacterized protein n=1 Tax=Schistosoma mattheei TaxID=31246 RepID=A0A183PLB2_9TREM|nr:unnamed protein product [Schistosoma mattheei]